MILIQYWGKYMKLKSKNIDILNELTFIKDGSGKFQVCLSARRYFIFDNSGGLPTIVYN